MILFIGTANMKAQSGTEDKEGNSSLFLPIGNLSLNTTDARIKAYYSTGFPSIGSYTKIEKYKTSKVVKLTAEDSAFFTSKYVNRFAFAMGAEGSNADGGAAIFADGHITPESKLFAAFGAKFYFSDYNLFKKGREASRLILRMDTLQRDLTNTNITLKNRFEIYKKFYSDNIDSTIKNTSKTIAGIKSIDSTAKRLPLETKVKLLKKTKQFIDTLSSAWDGSLVWKPAFDSLCIIQLYNQALFDSIKDTDEVPGLFSPRKDSAKNTAAYIKANGFEYNMSNIKNTLVFTDSLIKKNKNRYILAFISAERNYRKFKLLQDSYTTLDDRYKDQVFDGFSVRANVNWFFNQHSIVGLSFGYQQTDNYDAMDDFKIESATSITDSNRVDKTTKEITGKKGIYTPYFQYPLMLDYAYIISPGDEVYIFNPYFRYNFVTKNDLDIKSSGKVGLAVYALKKEKSKFLFGVYTELAVPRDPAEKRNAYQRMSFGIITKFNLIPYTYDRINPVN